VIFLNLSRDLKVSSRCSLRLSLQAPRLKSWGLCFSGHIAKTLCAIEVFAWWNRSVHHVYSSPAATVISKPAARVLAKAFCPKGPSENKDIRVRGWFYRSMGRRFLRRRASRARRSSLLHRYKVNADTLADPGQQSRPEFCSFQQSPRSSKSSRTMNRFCQPAKQGGRAGCLLTRAKAM
jgi:hypothetical protein